MTEHEHDRSVSAETEESVAGVIEMEWPAGRPYPPPKENWEFEYEEWSNARRAENRPLETYLPAERLVDPVNNLRAMKEMKARPEIWDLIVEHVKQQDEAGQSICVEMHHYLKKLIWTFVAVFKFRNNLQDVEGGYDPWILHEWASGRIDPDDDDASIRFIRAHGFFVKQD